MQLCGGVTLQQWHQHAESAVIEEGDNVSVVSTQLGYGEETDGLQTNIFVAQQVR